MKLKLIAIFLLMAAFTTAAFAQQSGHRSAETVQYQFNDDDTGNSFEERCCAKGGSGGKNITAENKSGCAGTAGNAACAAKCSSKCPKAANATHKSGTGKALKSAGKKKDCCQKQQ